MAAVGLPYAFRISNQKPVGKSCVRSTAQEQCLTVAALVSGLYKRGLHKKDRPVQGGVILVGVSGNEPLTSLRVVF